MLLYVMHATAVDSSLVQHQVYNMISDKICPGIRYQVPYYQKKKPYLVQLLIVSSLRIYIPGMYMEKASKNKTSRRQRPKYSKRSKVCRPVVALFRFQSSYIASSLLQFILYISRPRSQGFTNRSIHWTEGSTEKGCRLNRIDLGPRAV